MQRECNVLSDALLQCAQAQVLDAFRSGASTNRGAMSNSSLTFKPSLRRACAASAGLLRTKLQRAAARLAGTAAAGALFRPDCPTARDGQSAEA